MANDTPRTGVAPGLPALELVRVINSMPHVRFAGIQAYDATASHTEGFENRSRRSRETMRLAAETRWLLEREGIPCPLVTGRSTGTCSIDSEIEGITEIQPGSFVFMDIEYSRIGGPDGPEYCDFQSALSVLGTVIHKRPGIAIVDAGVKSFSTDRPICPEAKTLQGATYSWAGDEYGRLNLSGASADIEPGERVEFRVPHCDPTVNVYDRMYGVRGEAVELAWKIAGRGMSQ